MTAESHDWALKHVGEVAEALGVDCEYRMLKGYDVSQYPVGTKEHEEDMKEFKKKLTWPMNLASSSSSTRISQSKVGTGSQIIVAGLSLAAKRHSTLPSILWEC